MYCTSDKPTKLQKKIWMRDDNSQSFMKSSTVGIDTRMKRKMENTVALLHQRRWNRTQSEYLIILLTTLGPISNYRRSLRWWGNNDKRRRLDWVIGTCISTMEINLFSPPLLGSRMLLLNFYLIDRILLPLNLFIVDHIPTSSSCNILYRFKPFKQQHYHHHYQNLPFLT